MDDLPRGYRLSLTDPQPEPFGEFDTVRAVWFQLDESMFRSAQRRD
ncbi:hypothetical protein [Microbacterium sp.]